LFDTIWLVPAVLLWAVGIVLASVSYVRLRFPAQRPGTSGGASLVPSLFVLAASIGSLLAVKWYFGLAGLALGILCLAAVHVATSVAGTFSVMRDHRATLAAYDGLLQRGLRRDEALREVSRARHPELSPATHAKVAARCGEISRLFFFYDTCAELGQRVLSDAHVRACLDSSTPVQRGPAEGVYYYKQDHAAYLRALESFRSADGTDGKRSTESSAG